MRVLGVCGGYTSDTAAALQWAAGLAVPGIPTNPNPAKIINMSRGGPSLSNFEEQAFASFLSQGILLIAAAGNDGTTNFSYPASYGNVLSVAAIDSNKQVASFS